MATISAVISAEPAAFQAGDAEDAEHEEQHDDGEGRDWCRQRQAAAERFVIVLPHRWTPYSTQPAMTLGALLAKERSGAATPRSRPSQPAFARARGRRRVARVAASPASAAGQTRFRLHMHLGNSPGSSGSNRPSGSVRSFVGYEDGRLRRSGRDTGHTPAIADRRGCRTPRHVHWSISWRRGVACWSSGLSKSHLGPPALGGSRAESQTNEPKDTTGPCLSRTKQASCPGACERRRRV